MEELSIVSVNCKSLRSNMKFINELCNTNDIVLLQETWLLPSDLQILDSIHSDFLSVATSAVDTSSAIIVGRPYGGAAILYKKSLKVSANIQTDTPRLVAVEVTLRNNEPILIVCVYLPTCKTDNFDEYAECLGKVHGIIENSNCNSCLILGDFNAHPSSSFGRELSSFCTEYRYEQIDQKFLPADSYTYLSDAHGTTSWLDHCLATETISKCVENVSIDYSTTWTDHRPLKILLKVQGLTKFAIPENKTPNQYAWKPRSLLQTKHYTNNIV